MKNSKAIVYLQKRRDQYSRIKKDQMLWYWGIRSHFDGHISWSLRGRRTMKAAQNAARKEIDMPNAEIEWRVM